MVSVFTGLPPGPRLPRNFAEDRLYIICILLAVTEYEYNQRSKINTHQKVKGDMFSVFPEICSVIASTKIVLKFTYILRVYACLILFVYHSFRQNNYCQLCFRIF